MKLELDAKRVSILAAEGHLLVKGGPGAGKTTIALLKAQALLSTLGAAQEVLFLSFSRAAVRAVLVRCKTILKAAERKQIEVQTYHSFCLELLKSHGRLLTGKPTSIRYPDEERLQKAAFDGDWADEAGRLAREQALFGFDQFAGAAADLVEGCAALRRLIGRKYPLIIVDEFQDTDDDQWRLVAALSKVTTIFCLADPDQSIFQYQSKVDPLRIERAIAFLKPTVTDLAGDNHRSPNSGILKFADAVLHDTALPKPCPEVAQINYPPRMFSTMTHAAVIWMFGQLAKQGIENPSIAVLCRSNALVSDISTILSEEHVYKTSTLKPVGHEVVWDAELSAAAAVVLASILEWPRTPPAESAAATMRAAAAYCRLKAAIDNTQTAKAAAKGFDEAAEAALAGRPLRNKFGKEISAAAAVGVGLLGDPVVDWRAARAVLATIPVLEDVVRQVRLVRLFRATDALGRGLSSMWVNTGTYQGATIFVKKTLDQERLMSAELEPQGVLVMNIHKSKGKEFDGVILVEGQFKSHFFDLARDPPPSPHARRLLRVAITRARRRVAIIRASGTYPPLAPA
ncbi:ATP-dependent helicase [Roseomonas tokyonensis]|nr:ATP-dependent helicase [Falsiroseomonas tokyonensis]